MRHRGAQVVQLAGEHDAAVVDDDDVLAQVLDQVELVAREQHRRARGGELGEQLGHGADRDRIEAGERLVEHEQLRLVDERGDQLDALLVAVRQRVEAVARAIGEAEPLEPGVDAAVDVRARRVRRAGRGTRVGRAPACGDTGPAPRACSRTVLRSAAPIGAPCQRTAPASSSTSPNTARIAVVFPAPFGPRKPVSRPGRAANVHPSSADS